MSENISDLKQQHHDLCIFADEVATRLNAVIIDLLGEEADWNNHVGSTSIPKELDLKVIDTSFVETLWILREGANGICASNDGFGQTQFESTDYEERIERLKRQANELLSANLRCNDQILRMKTGFTTTLRALELLLSSSVNTEDNHLTHRVRNFRTQHQVEIIQSQLKTLQRTPSTYDDEF